MSLRVASRPGSPEGGRCSKNALLTQGCRESLPRPMPESPGPCLLQCNKPAVRQETVTR